MSDSPFVIELKSLGRDLSSRHEAAGIRRNILERVSQGERTVLDFSDVRTLSDSFADELIAVLVQEEGETWFRENVTATNLTPAVRRTILMTVARRTESAK
jgi:anti-anti-sigma regulatory factor